MELVKVSIKDIIPYDNNARKNDEAVKAVMESIKQCEYVAPIIVDENNVILAGHTRLKALKKLGYTEVEVIIKKGLNEAQKRKYRLLDNKTNEIAEWDFEKLANELEDLDFGDLELNWGVEVETETEKEVEEDEFSIDTVLEEPETKAKLGDVWKLGEHRLMCGSSTEEKDVEALINGELVDLVVTDPPYNVNYGSINETGYSKERNNANKILNDNMDDMSFNKFLFDFYTQMNNVLKPGGAFYIFHADSEGLNFRGALKDAGLQVRQTLIWVKNALVLGRQDYQWKHEPCLYGWKDGAAHFFIDDRSQTTVFEDEEKKDIKKMTKPELIKLISDMKIMSEPNTTIIHENKPNLNDLHPTMKPVRLCGRLIKNSSKIGQIVYDGFGGSGSTLMACEQLGRKARLMELDPKYCDVIIARWEKFTGQTAEKIN